MIAISSKPPQDTPKTSSITIGVADISSFEILPPTTCLKNSEVVLNSHSFHPKIEQNESREQVEEHQNLNNQQYLEYLEERKKNMAQYINNLIENQSFFSKFSTWWYAHNLIQKITLSIFCMAPLICLGLATQLIIITAIGITSALFSGLFIFFAENYVNHHQQQINISKNTFNALFSSLELIINNLLAIKTHVTKELDVLQQTNQQLSENNKQYNDELQQLNQSNELLQKNNAALKALNEQLHATRIRMEQTLQEQKVLLEQNQNHLEHAIKKQQTTQNELSAAVTQITTLKNKFTQDLCKSQQVTAALELAMNSLSGIELQQSEHQTNEIEKEQHLFFYHLFGGSQHTIKNMPVAPNAIVPENPNSLRS